jgi:hypothetical protein
MHKLNKCMLFSWRIYRTEVFWFITLNNRLKQLQVDRGKDKSRSEICSEITTTNFLPLGWETKFHTHVKQVAKLYIYQFNLRVLCRKREDKGFWTKFNLSLTYSWMELRFSVVPKLWTRSHVWGTIRFLYIVNLSSGAESWTCTRFSLSLFLDIPPYNCLLGLRTMITTVMGCNAFDICLWFIIIAVINSIYTFITLNI